MTVFLKPLNYQRSLILWSESVGGPRYGLSLIEVGVVVVLIALAVLIGVTVIPIHREAAREAVCRARLGRIGLGLNLAVQIQGRLPVTPALSALGSSGEPAPASRSGWSPQMAIQAMLRDDSADPAAQTSLPKGDPAASNPGGSNKAMASLDLWSDPNWVCPSDGQARGSPFEAAVSYRAVAGDDPEGRTGLFAPETPRTYEEVQQADGASYTAAFVERRLGNGRDGVMFGGNYAVVNGPVGPQTPVDRASLPAAEFWRGDAGCDRAEVSWRSTLANFASTPGQTWGGVIARDQRTAKMTGSSDHPNRVHLLLLDGRVQAYTPTIDLKVWKALAHPFDSQTASSSARAELPSPWSGGQAPLDPRPCVP